MRKTTRGLLGILLALALVFGTLGFIPIIAQAAATATDITIDSFTINGASMPSISEEQVGNNWHWNGIDTLTLEAGYSGGPIEITATGTVNLVLTGDVAIIGMPTSITCTGAGSKLVINAGAHELRLSGDNGAALKADSLEIASGTVIAGAGSSIVILGSVAVTGGTLRVANGTATGNTTMTGNSTVAINGPEITLIQSTGGTATVTIPAEQTTNYNVIALNASANTNYDFELWTATAGTIATPASATATLDASGGDFNEITITPSYTYTPPSSCSSSDSGNSGNSRASEPIPTLSFKWDGVDTLTVTGDGISVRNLENVWWNNNTTTEFVARNGSVIIKFNKEFLSKQKPGDHRVRVEFMNIAGETTVKLKSIVAETDDIPAETNFNPRTGR